MSLTNSSISVRKCLIIGPTEGVASSPDRYIGRTINNQQKTIYGPLYITVPVPSIGYGRRGNI
jgi:hypothetical protein